MSQLIKHLNRNHYSSARRLADTFGDKMAIGQDVKVDSSTFIGVASLDVALGPLPAGIIEFVGPESTGKTGLLYNTLAQSLRMGRPTALWAHEVVDVPYMERAGVDTTALVVLLGNGAQEHFHDFIRSNEDCVVGIDSLTAFRPKSEKELSDWNELMWTFLEETQDNLRHGSCVVAVSQVRNKLGTKGKKSASWRFADHFQLRLEFLRTEVQDEKYKLLINIAASRNVLPQRIIELPFIKGTGVDIVRDQLRCAVQLGIVEKRGNWYYLGSVGKIGHGENSAVSRLEKYEIGGILRGFIANHLAGKRGL